MFDLHGKECHKLNLSFLKQAEWKPSNTLQPPASVYFSSLRRLGANQRNNANYYDSPRRMLHSASRRDLSHSSSPARQPSDAAPPVGRAVSRTRQQTRRTFSKTGWSFVTTVGQAARTASGCCRARMQPPRSSSSTWRASRAYRRAGCQRMHRQGRAVAQARAERSSAACG